MRSLQGFTPDLLIQEAKDGQDLSDALAAALSEECVSRSALGPKIAEDDVLSLLLEMAGQTETSRVPAEAAAAVGMLLLRDKGVVTVNTHGQPGGRVSIRLKPTTGAVSRVGGASAMADALLQAMRETAAHLEDTAWFANLLFGETQ
jgi:L-seryl-tRNA(Ser) seleniumtransferase